MHQFASLSVSILPNCLLLPSYYSCVWCILTALPSNSRACTDTHTHTHTPLPQLPRPPPRTSLPALPFIPPRPHFVKPPLAVRMSVMDVLAIISSEGVVCFCLRQPKIETSGSNVYSRLCILCAHHHPRALRLSSPAEDPISNGGMSRQK